jgi:DNA-binding MarR family transcriptional regulator
VILAALARNEDVSQAEIVCRTRVHRSTVAKIMHRIVKAGHLKRARSRADARAYVLYLAPKGRAALRLVDAIATNIDSQLLAIVPMCLRTNVARYLRAIAADADREYGSA